jgi:transcription termination factor Rho
MKNRNPNYRQKRGKQQRSKPRKGKRSLLHVGPGRPQAGVLQFHKEGYGFLRADIRTFKERSLQDCFVPVQLIRQFGLRPGSYVEGEVALEKKKDLHVLRAVYRVDGLPAETAARRPRFNTLTVIDPTDKLRLENSAGDLSLRVLDLITPIGRGQRCLVISPPRAGKTVLLQKIAAVVARNHPDIHLMVVLVDERPEEVTDWRRTTRGEVVSSSSDEAPSNHVMVSEVALARAKRLVESGRHVMILMDSLTRLGRAYNLETKETGRTLSGGLDASVLDKPKAFFGAARAIENAGSLTIVATCLVDTGSRLDQVIYEEFKGTGNMECILSRQLAELRIWPAVDIKVSGTRKEERLIPPEQLRQIWILRRVLQTVDLRRGARIFHQKLSETRSNAEFLASFSVNQMGT